MPVGGPRAIAQGLPNVHKPRGSHPSPPRIRPRIPLRAPSSLSLPWRRLRVVSWYIHADSKSSAGPPPAPPSPGLGPNPPPASPGLDIRMLPIYGAYAVHVLPVAGLTRPEDDSKSSSYRRRLRVERRQRQRRLKVERDSHRCRLAVEQRRGGGRK
ncbi:hypothetical protein BDZ89DRAFT_1053355 [Hymenopellis radicata]|nr:hypothetical protein BDZ89DRAFT_1053355 [Hymenopellis radicata]